MHPTVLVCRGDKKGLSVTGDSGPKRAEVAKPHTVHIIQRPIIVSRCLQIMKKLETGTYYVPVYLAGTSMYVGKKQLSEGLLQCPETLGEARKAAAAHRPRAQDSEPPGEPMGATFKQEEEEAIPPSLPPGECLRGRNLRAARSSQEMC